MKKVLSFVLCLTLCLGLLSVATPAMAADLSSLSYLIEDGQVTITGCERAAEGELVIPDTIEGYPVTAIGIRGFAFCRKLTKVTIPKGVTVIDSNAFSHCEGMTEVVIPDTVTEIGYKAFYNCTSLPLVELPQGLTTIGSWAFEGCTALKEVTIPGSLTAIAMNAFTECSGLTEVTICEGVTKIEMGAFSNCENLTTVNLPDSLTVIEDIAFENCTSLAGVNFPEGLTDIGNSAFSNCDSLTEVTIPASVNTKRSSMFYSCDNLTAIKVAEGNPIYSNDSHGVLFNIDKTSLLQAPGAIRSYEIPDTVTFIDNAAFLDCTSLEYLYIPASVNSIGSDAFVNCRSLTGFTVDPDSSYLSTDTRGVLFSKGNFYLYAAPGALSGSYQVPDGTQNINFSAFAECANLTDVTLPDSVTTIWSGAFRNCEKLTKVEIPDTVTQLGYYTFEGCTSLTEVNIPDGIPSIEDGLFYGCSGLTDVEIPDSVTVIGNSAFNDCTSLATITIPDTVTEIGSLAFNNCTSLTTVTIPASVTYMDDYVFDDCSGLQTIYFCGDAPECYGSAFDGVTATAYYHPGTEGWDEYYQQLIGEELTWIEDHFYKDGFCTVCGIGVDGEMPGVEVSGTVAGLGEGEYTLTLTTADGEVKTLTTSGNGFTLEGVKAGEYVLSVSAEGYVTREYPVTVGDDALALDIKLHKQGDVTGDGRVNVGDVAKIYAHSKRSTLLTDDYQLLCADYTGDGRINVGDAAKVYALIKAK